MKRIKTFDELYQLENDEYESACSLDLMYLREAWYIVDGVLFLIGADCSTHAQLVFVATEDYQKWTDGEKDYVKHYFGL